MTASAMLLLPQPLGPTIAVIPPAKSTVVSSTKDLKPESWSRSIFSMARMRCCRGTRAAFDAGG